MVTHNTQKLFVEIIDKNKGILYKVAHAYCFNVNDQKELVQEITFQLWKSFGSYKQEYKVSTWMYRIALNVAISALRKNKVREAVHVPLEDGWLQLTSDTDTDLSEEVQLLREFIQQQKKLDKALLLLYLDEKSYAEIAEMLGISTSNVGTKLNRLKEKLKHHFAQKML